MYHKFEPDKNKRCTVCLSQENGEDHTLHPVQIAATSTFQMAVLLNDGRIWIAPLDTKLSGYFLPEGWKDVDSQGPPA